MFWKCPLLSSEWLSKPSPCKRLCSDKTHPKPKYFMVLWKFGLSTVWILLDSAGRALFSHLLMSKVQDFVELPLNVCPVHLHEWICIHWWLWAFSGSGASFAVVFVCTMSLKYGKVYFLEEALETDVHSQRQNGLSFLFQVIRENLLVFLALLGQREREETQGFQVKWALIAHSNNTKF